MLGGRRWTATLMGFFESFIWLMAISQIFGHLDNWICYIAYPAGFATGIFVGMIIEERIAYGKVIVRIITRKDVNQLIDYLNDNELRFTHVNAQGPDGHENLVFTVLERERLEDVLYKLRDILPTAFYTVEKVNRATEVGTLSEDLTVEHSYVVKKCDKVMSESPHYFSRIMLSISSTYSRELASRGTLF